MSRRKTLRLLPVPAVLAAVVVTVLSAGPPAGAVPARGTGAEETVKMPVGGVLTVERYEVGGMEGDYLPPNAQVPPFRPTIDAAQYAELKRAANAGDGAAPAGVDVAPKPKKKNFKGADQSMSPFRPPDTHAAVGMTQVGEVSNTLIRIYQKRNGAVLSTATLNSFFNYTPELLFDPQIMYDLEANRWIVSAEAFPESDGSQRQFLAASFGEDATGPYHKYTICCVDDGGDFWDYPHLGMDDETVIVTANFFDGQTFAFIDARLFGVAKSDLYNGNPFSVPTFTGFAGTLSPPYVRDTGHPHFLAAEAPANNFELYRCENLELGNGGACFQEPNVPVPAFALPPNASQPGSADLLDTLDGRFVNMSYQQGNRLYNIHSIAIGGDAGLRWYEINHTNSTVAKMGDTQTSATSDDWNASNAVNELGEVFVSYSSTDAANGRNAQVRATGRQAADVNMGKGSRIFQSTTFYNPSSDVPERWGDYSSVALDPKAYGTCAAHRRAWVANEYVLNAAQWANRHARVGFC